MNEVSGKVGDAERVLEAVLAGAGVDEVGGAELLEFAEALDVGGVDEVEGVLRDLEVAVDGIVDD